MIFAPPPNKCLKRIIDRIVELPWAPSGYTMNFQKLNCVDGWTVFGASRVLALLDLDLDLDDLNYILGEVCRGWRVQQQRGEDVRRPEAQDLQDWRQGCLRNDRSPVRN